MIDLKREIFNAMKRNIKEHGYGKATFQLIADELGITKGAITYHYNNKHIIGAMIVADYYRKVREYIMKYPDEYVNEYWLYCTMYIYTYQDMFNSKNSTDLIYGEKEIISWTKLVLETISENYVNIAKDFNMPITHEIAKMNALIDFGARRYMFSRYLHEPNEYTPEMLLNYHVHMIGTLAKLDDAVVIDSISKAFDFVRRHSDMNIKLL